MSIAIEEAPVAVAEHLDKINDFSIKVATVNGSGSQTSNSVLLRAFFTSGNIQL